MDLTQTLYEVDARAIATVTFDNPKKRNVMNPAFMDDLNLVMDAAVSQDVRALVMTGAGDFFCAGGDLGWMQTQMKLTLKERVAGSRQLAEVLTRLDELPLLTIAKINGPAFGGGLGLIAACDMAFSAPTATFALSEGRLGLSPSNISPFVVRRMGVSNARRTFLNAKMMDAAFAQRLGLVTEVVDDLDAAVEVELTNLLACGPEAVAATKSLIGYISTHSDDENRRYTASHLAEAWARAEAQEGIAAFFEKRHADWRIE
jgi:methylglutaconyl-CoA hydratase